MGRLTSEVPTARLYLVPCKLRLGVLPTQAPCDHLAILISSESVSFLRQELLHKYDLDVFVDVVKAIKEATTELV